MIFSKIFYYVSFLFIIYACSPTKKDTQTTAKLNNQTILEPKAPTPPTSATNDPTTTATESPPPPQDTEQNQKSPDANIATIDIPEAMKAKESDSKEQLEEKLAQINSSLTIEVQKIVMILSVYVDQFTECKKKDKDATPLITEAQVQQLKTMKSEDLVAYLLSLLTANSQTTVLSNEAPAITTFAGGTALLVASAAAAAASHNFYKANNKVASGIAGAAAAAAIGGSACVFTNCIGLIDSSQGACAQVNNAAALGLKDRLVTLGNLDGGKKAITELLKSKP